MKLLRFSILVMMLCLGACRGYGSTYWLATAHEHDVQRYLQTASHQRICNLANRSTLTTEVQAIDRALKEYQRRGLNYHKCGQAYVSCLDLGIPEETSDFNKCLIETSNTLALKNEIKKLRREYERAQDEARDLRYELKKYKHDKHVHPK